MSDAEDVFGVLAEPGNGAAHEATCRLSCYAEAFADFAEALALSVDEPKTGFHCVAGACIERAEQIAEQIAFDADHDRIFGRGVTIGHQIAEGRIAVVADGLVEAHRCGEAVQFGICLIEGLAVARCLTQRSAQAGRAVTGDTDEAGLLVERTTDGLADPEGGVGGKLEATAPVELVDRVLETEVALLDEVEQVHALGQRVSTRNGDHQPQVRADEAVLGVGGSRLFSLEVGAAASLDVAGSEQFSGFASLFDFAGQHPLIFSSEQRHLADVVQVESN